MATKSIVPRVDNEGEVGENTTPKYWQSGYFYNLITKGSPWVDVNAYTSFSAAIDAIGATKKTLMIPNQQNVIADKTVPSNVTLKFTQGGSLNISTAKTVTINGHVEAGLYQIFEGDGSVSFGSGSVKLFPQWWGASPSAAAAINDAAFAASITALPDYGSWELPGGEYDISGAITFSGKESCNINFVGRLMCQSCSGISFDDVHRCDIRNIYAYLETGTTWENGYYGIKFKDFTKNRVSIRRTFIFEKAIYLDGDTSGIGYNQFFLGDIFNSKHGIYIRSVNAGWVNENSYYGGQIQLYSVTKATESGGWAIYFEGSPSNVYNNHKFHGTSIETYHNGIQFNACYNIQLSQPRFESVDANWVNGGSALFNLVWILGADIFNEAKVSFNANSKGLLILGADYGTSGYRPIITDATYGGISFISRYSLDDTVAHLFLISGYGQGLVHKDIWSELQTFNKAYEGSSVPTSGTYRANAVRWKPPVSGQSMGWVCSVGGTAGTLVGVTGSITNGQKKLTVNDASDLLEGMAITIVGVTGTKWIEYIDGNDVYLYTTSDATVVDAAVAYSNPTWVIMPNYA